jgi:hypothetical protein
LKATWVVIAKMKEEAQQNIRRYYTAPSSHDGETSRRLIISSASTVMHAHFYLKDGKEHGNLQTEQVMIGTAVPTSRNSGRRTTTEWQQLKQNDMVAKTLSSYAYAWVVGGIHEDRQVFNHQHDAVQTSYVLGRRHTSHDKLLGLLLPPL